MEINVSNEQGRVPITIFELNGLLNLGSAPLLEQEAQKEYAAGMRYLLIDLSEVDSLTSAGLRAIHVIYSLLSGGVQSSDAFPDAPDKTNTINKSPYLKLLNPRPHIRRVLNISGFDMFIQLLDDRQEAIDSF